MGRVIQHGRIPVTGQVAAVVATISIGPFEPEMRVLIVKPIRPRKGKAHVD